MSDIPVVEEFTFIKYRCVTVSENEVDDVLKRIKEIGTFDFEEESRERQFAVVQYYTLLDDNEAEIFWKDPEKKELGTIRISVVYDEKEEEMFNQLHHCLKRNDSEEAVGDSFSNSLSPYMRYAYEKALGLDVEESYD